jgi:hypothetical protein
MLAGKIGVSDNALSLHWTSTLKVYELGMGEIGLII